MYRKSQELSAYLKQMRIKAGLTQIEIAEQLGYASPQFVSNWERALAAPPVHALSQLVALYDLEVDRVIEMCIAPLRGDLERALKPRARRKK